MRESLCVRRGGLGDTLLVVPMLRAMRARAPAARLTFAGVSEFALLLARHGVADAVRSTEDLGLWALRAGGDAAGRAQRVLAAFDWIVGDDAALACVASAQRRVDVFDPVLAGDVRVPAAAQLLARAGLPGGAEVALIEARAPLPERAPVVLHPGSGSATKCWPRAALRALAVALADVAPLRVVLGPAELERGEQAGWPARAEVVVPATADALADALASARTYVGHDAGPTHLAAALRVPTIALFVGTDPAVWAPAGAHVVTGAPTAATIAAIARRA